MKLFQIPKGSRKRSPKRYKIVRDSFDGCCPGVDYVIVDTLPQEVARFENPEEAEQELARLRAEEAIRQQELASRVDRIHHGGGDRDPWAIIGESISEDVDIS